MNLQDTFAQHYPNKTAAWREGYAGWSYLLGESRQNPYPKASEAWQQFLAGQRQAATDYDNRKEN